MPYPPTIVSLPRCEYEFTPLNDLTNDENAAIEIIRGVLRTNGLPDEPLFFRRTEKYLTVGASEYLPFARLKLNKNLWYISLRVGDLDTSKNFRRFEISDVSEISRYSAEIVDAFQSLTDEISTYQAPALTADTGSEIEDFFRNAKASGKPTTYIPTPDESTFFLAYIEGLKTSGLNWRSVPVEIMSDGAVKVRGGRIRLSKKATYISYTKSSNELATKEKNLSLSEYIELQKYWLADCLENRELYGL